MNRQRPPHLVVEGDALGIAAARIGRRVETVDVAPTIAAYLGIRPPSGTRGRVMTEVGISMMVGGNIKWHTRTITTAIALETNKGQFALGIALGIVLLVIAFIVNLSVSSLRKRAGV